MPLLTVHPPKSGPALRISSDARASASELALAVLSDWIVRVWPVGRAKDVSVDIVAWPTWAAASSRGLRPLWRPIFSYQQQEG